MVDLPQGRSFAAHASIRVSMSVSTYAAAFSFGLNHKRRLHTRSSIMDKFIPPLWVPHHWQIEEGEVGRGCLSPFIPFSSSFHFLLLCDPYISTTLPTVLELRWSSSLALSIMAMDCGWFVKGGIGHAQTKEGEISVNYTIEDEKVSTRQKWILLQVNRRWRVRFIANL